ncbi:hypothetical protein GCM10010420_09990 [Streptomyces glaucosporus]|uniref:Secreted protein n=1 Tax=Streptomyces glaucosporus TaxID=284044 RepID=A0ABN3HW57_9ACTN
MRRITTTLGSLAAAALMTLSVPTSASAAEGLLVLGDRSFQNPSGCYALLGDRGGRAVTLEEGAAADIAAQLPADTPAGTATDTPATTTPATTPTGGGNDDGRGGDGRGRETTVGNYTNRAALIFEGDYCTGYAVDTVYPGEHVEVEGRSLFIR